MPIEDMKAYKRAWRAARKAAGVCYDCGSPSEGFAKCESCRAKDRRGNLSTIRLAQRRGRDDSVYRRRDAERRAAGVCLGCGRPRDSEKVRCESCLAKTRKDMSRRYARLAGNGKCFFCQNPFAGGVVCPDCNRKAYERADRLKMILKDHRRKARLKAGGVLLPEEWLALLGFCGSTCLRCLAKEPDVQITIDHIVPISRNGANTIRNVQPLCSRCNKSKNARTVDFRTPGILAFVREMFIT
jgi:hypothetical protein